MTQQDSIIQQDSYITIAEAGEGCYVESRSRFLAFALHAGSEEEVKEILAAFRKKYYDARHVCYAYVLGDHGDRTRQNDDGEPSSTAGKPILGQIISNDLSNVLIVVIRYFGGIKLGVSGLIQAYKEAAADAINHAEVVERTVDEVIHVRFTYVVMNDVMKVLKEEEPDILSRNFEMECEMTLSIRQKDMPRLRERLLKIESLSIEE